MRNFKVIIFDFDGVILESEQIKDQGFEYIFRDYPQAQGKIMEYHLANSARTRFEKFQHISEKILHIPYTDELRQKYSREFSRFVFEGVKNCPFVPGARELLEVYYPKFPLYVVSVTPEEDLTKIAQVRDLLKYFKKIYGTPWRKREALKDILEREKIAPQDAVFIGDTYQDYQASADTGIPFIGRRNGKSFADCPAPLCDDLTGVRKILDHGRISG